MCNCRLVLVPLYTTAASLPDLKNSKVLLDMHSAVTVSFASAASPLSEWIKEDRFSFTQKIFETRQSILLMYF